MNRSVLYAVVWSHVVTFLTLAVILSGLPSNGMTALPVWLGFGVAIGLLPLLRRSFFVPGIVLLLASGLGLYLLYQGFEIIPCLILLMLGGLLLHRLIQMESSLQGLQQELREQLVIDASAIAVAYFLTSLVGYGSNADWQQAVLPFLLACFALRLYALSASFQALRRTKLDLTQKRRPATTLIFFLIGVGFLVWCLNLAGPSVRDAVYAVLSVLLYPFVYVIGHLLQFFLERYHLRWMLPESDPSSASNNFNDPLDPAQQVDWQAAGLEWTLYGLMFGIGIYLLYRMARAVKKRQVSHDRAYVQETREFLHQKEQLKQQPPAPSERAGEQSLTKMRQIYRDFLRHMEQRGLHRLPHESPLEFLARVEPHLPDAREHLLHLTELYMWERYGERNMSDAQTEQLASDLLKKIT